MSSTGKIAEDLGVTAKRADKSGNVAMVAGSARHLFVSKDGTSQTGYARGHPQLQAVQFRWGRGQDAQS